ncbi:MAG: hypothetical protein V4662_01015, partial [Verrucomicrobiota bacterium]
APGQFNHPPPQHPAPPPPGQNNAALPINPAVPAPGQFNHPPPQHPAPPPPGQNNAALPINPAVPAPGQFNHPPPLDNAPPPPAVANQNPAPPAVNSQNANGPVEVKQEGLSKEKVSEGLKRSRSEPNLASHQQDLGGEKTEGGKKTLREGGWKGAKPSIQPKPGGNSLRSSSS